MAPLNQAPLTEAKKVQQAKAEAKQGSIFLTMTDTSHIHFLYKLNTFQDLQSLQTGEEYTRTIYTAQYHCS